jgi:hypothetical protein
MGYSVFIYLFYLFSLILLSSFLCDGVKRGVWICDDEGVCRYIYFIYV